MDLQTIRAKVRTLIGDSSYDQTELDRIINLKYQRELPLEFELEALKGTFCQITSEGEWLYPVDPDTYLTIRQPAYLDGEPVSFFLDVGGFFELYPSAREQSFSITGVDIANDQFQIAGKYSSKFSSPNTFRVYGSTGNDGMWTVSSSVYAANVTTITTVENIADATVDGNIRLQANSTPNAVLYAHHQLVLEPPPDDNYGANHLFVAETIIVPDALVAVAQTPIEELWGMVIAIDAAIEILMDTSRKEDAEGLYELRKLHASQIFRKEALDYLNHRGKPSF